VDALSRLQAAMSARGLILLVELPSNSSELSSVVEQGGADSVLLQLFNEHPVTSAYTGGPDLEAQQIKDLMSTLKLPVGIHLGNQKVVTKEEWEQVVSLGFDYAAIGVSKLPPFVLRDGRLPILLYVQPGMPFEYYRVLCGYDNILATSFETSSQVQSEGANKFSVLDLVTLQLVSKLSDTKPVIFRVSQDVSGDDVQSLVDNGCRGLLLDPAFTATNAEFFKAYTAQFREAIDALKKKTVSHIQSWQ
jgi:hypothetical protein